MKKKLLHILPCVAAAFAFNQAKAQDYQAIPIATGLNADVIANGIGTPLSSTTIDIDGVNYNYISTDFQLNAESDPLTYGVPSNGLINSIVEATPGLSFQLAPLSGNNSLRLDADTTTGTITFETPITAINLYMLAVTGSGAGTVDVVVNFDDDTSQTFEDVSVPDWYNATNPPPAIMGIGRINRETNALEPNATNPRMYQITLAISPGNQPKPIESVQITQIVDDEEVVNVFAFSAEVLPECPPPVNLQGTSTANGGTISWDAAVVIPAEGYDYIFAETDAPPTEETEITGTTEDTSVSFSDLDTGVEYYVWVRSNCGEGLTGDWKMGSFTTGQMSATYTDGDISTHYLDPPTIDSETDCPGTLSITVPEGYQIASVATSYDMSTASNGWISEQRSLLVCTTNDTSEDSLAFYDDEENSYDIGGTINYNRDDIDIANGLTGVVNFELRAWRTYQGFPATICGVTHNKVDNNTWTITITYEPVTTSDCDTPEAPEEQAVCGPATVADLTATGEEGATINWYETGDSEEALGMDAEIETGSYFVSQTIGDCESERVEVAVTVTEVEELEVESMMVCVGSVIGDLEVEAEEGATVNWYETEDSEMALDGEMVVEDGTYFVSQSIGDCESERAEVEIVTIELEPAEPGSSETICGGTTVNDIQEMTEEITMNFYLTEDGEALSGETVLETGEYYVSASFMDCETERVLVELITITVEEPDTEPIQEFCGSATVANLQAEGLEGATINWYESPTSELLGNDAPLEDGSYFVSQVVDGCESAKVEMHVVINPIPDEPGGNEEQDFATGETVSDLDITAEEDAEIAWYILDEDVWVEISADTPLVDGQNYFVSQTINGCESEFHMITANDILGTSSFDRANLKVHPNPVSEVLTIANEGLLSEVKVTNLLGQVVISQKAQTNTVQVDMSGLASGNYIVQVQSAEGGTIALKIVKQ